MALQCNQIVNGLTVNDCYVKIGSINGDKYTIYLLVELKAGKENAPLWTRSFQFTPDMEGENFIKQGYEYLKTLDQFSGSKDV